MNTTVNGEPVPETAGNTRVRWEDRPNRHAYCDSEIRRLRASLDAAKTACVTYREQLAIARGRLTGIALGNAGDPSVAADKALIAIREAGSAPAIVTAGTEHVARQLLDPGDPDAWQRVADMPAEGR